MSAKLTPKSAIKLFCQECVCGDREAIRTCTSQKCPLYDFRPYKSKTATEKSEVKAARGKKVMTDEHKAKMKAAKAAKRAEKEAAGLPVTNRVKKAPKVKKDVAKSAAARARMTDAQKAKMKAGRQAKAALRKAGAVQAPAAPASVKFDAAKDKELKKLNPKFGRRTARGPEDL